MERIIAKHRHHLPAGEVVDLLDGNPEKGLDQFKVKHLHEHFGPNAITAQKGKGPLLRFLLQFYQPLIYILIAAGIITYMLSSLRSGYA